ncbi:hypothetical protein CC86DRAFT_384669 [Ophiobolus disseminans]|uniref:DUF8004 domain-containing protein n=1 Tax=Ophiobolus disseminans TaxID=1469910 RepID=A0A6A6ZSJ2_9PLEO|nr:hypothetical protein CC86DRAFT_384669 [Ophiobolus disseminans]
MSARGARGRKVQAKEVEKKEKKVGKSKAIGTIQDPQDASADWRATPSINNIRNNGISRSMTVSSRATSRSSGTNDSNQRPRLETLYSTGSSETRSGPPQSSASVSDVSTQGKDKIRFQAKGKDTKAPRGRGGGVPIKKTIVPPPASPVFRTESAASYPSPNQKSWINFKVWEGGKDGMRPYGGFEHDEDMSRGSVLVYFTEEQADDENPLPSIRAELEVLEKSGSTWLSNALLYSRIDENDDDWTLPNSPESSMSQQYYSQHGNQYGNQRMLGPTSPAGRSPPPWDIDQSYDGISTRAASRLDHFSELDRSGRPNSPPFHYTQRDPTHKLWFSAPKHVKTSQGQRMHHVAIRNFLAMLHGKPIVGADLFDMLSTLQPEIEVMYDLDNGQSNMTPRERSVQMITNYLGQHGIDDVRSSIKSAMCLLAWSEQENVKWRQGYLETFVHLAGVMIPQLEEVPEFKRLSIVTRRNLGIAAKTLQLRVMEAEEKLASFDFTDLWEDTSKVANSPVFQSYQAFRLFLVNYYTRNYGNWPPASNKTWMNRKIALALQEDFGSLYDYLVNRDVVWNPREERASRKWEMAHRKNDDFKADVPELGMTDLLVRFDAKFGYAHIPHPYPLLPRAIPKTTKEKEKKSFFSGLKKDKNKESTKDVKAHLQLSILFSDATNIEKLDVNFNGKLFPHCSTLIDKFEQFEMTTDLKNTTPREARLGRWVLLYGILQVLSTLSVDVHGLKHTEGVRYFLCTDLKRCPEWVLNNHISHLSARQTRSWCWQRAWDPAPTQTAPVELEAIQQSDPPPVHTNNELSATRSEAEAEVEPLDLNSNNGGLDGQTLLPNDMLHLTLDSKLALRRDNEKSIPTDFSTWAPRYDSLPHPQPPHPTPALLARDAYRGPNVNFPSRDFDFSPPARETMRTDLGGYPFRPEEVRWPVPPGYSERDEGRGVRESGVGYSVNGGERMESGDGDGRDWRSPRRMHERGGGWN